MIGPFIFVSHGRIKPGRLEDFKAYAVRFFPLVEEREPRILAFNTYLDEAGERYTSVQVHPDAASMEHHMKVMGEEIGATFEYVESAGVEVYGELSEAMLAMMRQIADVPVTPFTWPVSRGCRTADNHGAEDHEEERCVSDGC